MVDDSENVMGEAAQDVFACIIAILIVVTLYGFTMKATEVNTGRTIALPADAELAWHFVIEYSEKERDKFINDIDSGVVAVPRCSDMETIGIKFGIAYLETVSLDPVSSGYVEIRCSGIPERVIGYGPTGKWLFENWGKEYNRASGIIVEVARTTMIVTPDYEIRNHELGPQTDHEAAESSYILKKASELLKLLKGEETSGTSND